MAKQPGDAPGEFFSFLEPQKATDAPADGSASRPATPHSDDFLASFSRTNSPEKRPAQRQTATRSHQRSSATKLWIAGGIITVVLALVIGVLSSGGGGGFLRSKQDFYETVMKLARDSVDGVSKRSGQFVTPATAADSRRRQEIRQQLVSIGERMKQTQSAVNHQPDDQPQRAQFGPRAVTPPPVSFESTGGGELEQLQETSRRLSDEEGKLEHKLSYTLTAAKVKSILGVPDAVIKQESYRHVWIYRFSDGAVSLVVAGINGSYPDPGKDETFVEIDPGKVQME